MPAEIPWLAFVNLDKGYGYGHVMIDYKASKTLNPGTSISDGTLSRMEQKESLAKGIDPTGVITARYWSRHMISGGEMELAPGDQFSEVSAYVLFRCSKEKPVAELLDWQKRIERRFGSKAGVQPAR